MEAFLEEVLNLTRRPVPDVEAALFALDDGSTFAVASPQGMGDTERSIGFLVADLDEARETLQAAGVAVGDVGVNSLWRYAHFVAPDGQLYELVQSVRDRQVGSPPPDPPRWDLLTGERLRLRPLSPNDVEDHLRWRNDPEVRYWATASDPYFGPVSRQVLERAFTDTMLMLDPRSAGIFAVDLVDGRHIGMVDYRDLDPVARSATVGITIGEKDLWSQGHGTEALSLLIQHLFDTLNLRRVQLDTWSGNERAVRAFTKLGFREEGRLREAVRGPGGYRDRIVMGLLRRDWSPNQAG
jgi:RimJ/RimL family protein N-acetyltransferase